jgi:cold shock CspA family protein/ribosome-associated translation inhibitor RaiA
MQVPLELSTRDLSEETAEHAKLLVREQVDKLDHMAHDIIACRVAVERPQRNHRTGNQYRVRIEATLAPGKKLVVAQEPGKHDPGDSLRQVVKHAFDAMRRQINTERQRRRGDVKTHHAEGFGFVVRMFPDAGFGFIQSAEGGHEVYFHHNSVIHRDLERLSVGTQVRYVEAQGDKGPQASTVQIIDKPGERLQPPGETGVEPPEGWERSPREHELET